MTGVNPASHPSSYITAQSVSLGDVGSIVFELDDTVAVVTRIADKVLLAAVGPSKLTHSTNGAIASTDPDNTQPINNGLAEERNPHAQAEPTSNGSGPGPTYSATSPPNDCPRESNMHSDAALETQYEIDRSSDLTRLASLNLAASPAILLALESKSAALGKFLGQKLEDLESPEDF